MGCVFISSMSYEKAGIGAIIVINWDEIAQSCDGRLPDRWTVLVFALLV